MNPDFFVEIGLEELPFVAMKQLFEEMPQAFEKWLQEQSIVHEESFFWVTPRRMVFYATKVEPLQKILPMKTKGPPVSVALQNEVETPALKGFLKKCGADTYEIETWNGQDYIFCTVQPPCKKIEDVVKDQFPLWIQAFPCSSQMNCHQYRFVRPVRWICSMYGDTLLPIALFSVTSDAYSLGLRGFPSIPIRSASEYRAIIKQNHIMLDTLERIQAIQNKESTQRPFHIVEKNAFCTEWPIVCNASFPPDLLQVPKEAICTMIEDHLICFTQQDQNGELTPSFQFVMNGPRDEKNVARGYEKVITAKLEDAKFFFLQDQKVPLQDRSSHIDRMIFMKGLGTVLQKTNRLLSLARAFPCGVDEEVLQRAAYLSKMDLSTHMVEELPELQGTMGRIYGSLQGENKDVCKALESYYFPKRESDPIPDDSIGRSLGIIDRIDTLSGAFSIGSSVSSSADPLGLRRQMNGLLRILYENPISIDLKKAFSYALSCYQTENHLEIQKEKVLQALSDFYSSRLLLFLQSFHRYDLVNAVLCSHWIHPFEAKETITLLETQLLEEEFKILCESFTRIQNITKGEYSCEPVQESLLKDPQEIALYDALKTMVPNENKSTDS
ncbi:MAG: glycine--tRNA ligase subunit beta, partial [Caldisericia bacterium]|nr:glycine--tRNA ligase subunit beta [Caldisericia bacterium]